MLQAVLFDMDGVLFDTERTVIQSELAVAGEMGYPLTEAMARQFLGINKAAVRAQCAAWFGPQFPFDAFRAETYRRAFARFETEGLPQKPCVGELLAYLKENGYPAAIASSSSAATIRHHLALAGLEDAFAALVGGDGVSHSKPHPEIYRKAAGALGFPPQHCLAIEDSPAGVQSAAAAGCITIMVPDLAPPTDALQAITAAILPNLCGVIPFLQHHGTPPHKEIP